MDKAENRPQAGPQDISYSSDHKHLNAAIAHQADNYNTDIADSDSCLYSSLYSNSQDRAFSVSSDFDNTTSFSIDLTQESDSNSWYRYNPLSTVTDMPMYMYSIVEEEDNEQRMNINSFTGNVYSTVPANNIQVPDYNGEPMVHLYGLKDTNIRSGGNMKIAPEKYTIGLNNNGPEHAESDDDTELDEDEKDAMYSNPDIRVAVTGVVFMIAGVILLLVPGIIKEDRYFRKTGYIICGSVLMVLALFLMGMNALWCWQNKRFLQQKAQERSQKHQLKQVTLDVQGLEPLNRPNIPGTVPMMKDQPAQLHVTKNTQKPSNPIIQSSPWVPRAPHSVRKTSVPSHDMPLVSRDASTRSATRGFLASCSSVQHRQHQNRTAKFQNVAAHMSSNKIVTPADKVGCSDVESTLNNVDSTSEQQSLTSERKHFLDWHTKTNASSLHDKSKTSGQQQQYSAVTRKQKNSVAKNKMTMAPTSRPCLGVVNPTCALDSSV